MPPTAATSASGVSDIPVRTLGEDKVPFEVLKMVPEESAEHYRFAPLSLKDGILEVGMVDPDNIQAVDALNFISRSSGAPFKVFRISDADFVKVLQMYRGLRGEVEEAVSEMQTEERARPSPKNESAEQAPLDLEDPSLGADKRTSQTIEEDAPAIKIVSTILRYAIDGKASDVHIEPLPQGVRVRYRVDGELHTTVILPLQTHRAVVARIKVLASIRLDERRKPQDGRFSASIDNRQIDFRVSTFPSYNGEKIVIRILDRDQGFIPLEKIGLSERNFSIIKKAISQPHGLILISGPTGSGKSTTMYSMLTELDRETKNVLSLEDPIEYFVDGVIQSQVHPEIGYTFATGLRTTLRQDPDIIMVGEIRDGETAKLAIQAALTGHLVLSTIHTNDAVGTIPRLIDMGVEPYLIPPVLICSIAQRLVRTFSPGAEKEYELSASERKAIEAELSSLPKEYRFPVPKMAYEAVRTPSSPTGMRGRQAVFEVLEMTSHLERIILENPIESKLWTSARQTGMYTMREDAIMKAIQKQVPYSEVNNLGTLLLAEDEPAAEEPKKDVKESKDEQEEQEAETTTI